MAFDHLKANAEKSKTVVFNKLNDALTTYMNNDEFNYKKLSVYKLSKLAGVDRSWAKKERYASILKELEAFNNYLTKPKSGKTAEEVRVNRFELLKREVEGLKNDNEVLLQQNALYKAEADHFQQEADNKTFKIKKLQERIANLTKQLNARAQKPVELDDFRK